MNTTKWLLDPAHSEIQFKVKHLMISNVTGHFKHFMVSAETNSTSFFPICIFIQSASGV